MLFLQFYEVKMSVKKVESRSHVASKLEFFWGIVKSQKPLTIASKSFILDHTEALDPGQAVWQSTEQFYITPGVQIKVDSNVLFKHSKKHNKMDINS